MGLQRRMLYELSSTVALIPAAAFQDSCLQALSANMKCELLANPDSPKGRNLG
jgi:hypothetical protein